MSHKNSASSSSRSIVWPNFQARCGTPSKNVRYQVIYSFLAEIKKIPSGLPLFNLKISDKYNCVRRFDRLYEVRPLINPRYLVFLPGPNLYYKIGRFILSRAVSKRGPYELQLMGQTLSE